MTDCYKMALSLENIKVSFGIKQVLKGVNAHFTGPGMHAIIGTNGTGKSVLMKSIAGILSYSGQIQLTDHAKTCSRTEIAYVPQTANLDSSLTAFEMILLGKLRELKFRVPDEFIKEVNDVMDLLKIKKLEDQIFGSLSGGQKQLVIMAQALISKPKLLLLDEPTSALDLYHQLNLLSIARNYCKDTGALALIIMHDLSQTARFCEDIVILKDGIVLESGYPQDVLTQKNIREVFNVDAEIGKSITGYTTVLPVNISN